MKSAITLLMILLLAVFFTAGCTTLPEDEAQYAKCKWKTGTYDPSACDKPLVSQDNGDYKGKSGFSQ